MDELKNYLLVERNQERQLIKREGWIATFQTSSTQQLSLPAKFGSMIAAWGMGFCCARWVIQLKGRGSQLFSGTILALLAYLATSRIIIPKLSEETQDTEPIYRAALQEVPTASDNAISREIDLAKAHAVHGAPSLDEQTRRLWIKGINLVEARWRQWRDHPMEQLDPQTLSIWWDEAKLVYGVLGNQFMCFLPTLTSGDIAQALQQILAAEELFLTEDLPLLDEKIQQHIRRRLVQLDMMRKKNPDFLAYALQADSWQQLRERWPKWTVDSHTS
jgi:hypothetical protein